MHFPFPIEGYERLERRDSTLGVFAFGPELTLHSPTDVHVVDSGRANGIGNYVLLSNPHLNHLYRFFLLDEVTVRGRFLSAGAPVGTATERAYYDILRLGKADRLFLPRGADAPELFINPKTLHDELY